jgi:ArsR family transcriptional regulator, arsenate/arsenite/antimonite-responsive transcriptional repressor
MSIVLKALADPTRRRILELLRVRPMTAGEIAGHFTVAKPTLSGHFAVLREADLVAAEKQGTSITYRLKLSVLEEAIAELADLFKVGQPKQAIRRKRWTPAKSQ